MKENGDKDTVDGDMSLRDAHDIAILTETRIRESLPGMSVCATTHIEPAKK